MQQYDQHGQAQFGAPQYVDQQQYYPPQQQQQGGYTDVVGKQVFSPSTGGQEHGVLDKTGKYQVKYKGAFAAVEVAVGPNDGMKAEAGVMITLSHNVDINARTEGGAGTSLLLGCCTNESFFFSHFLLKPGMGDRGDVLLAPGLPGEIILLELDGSTSWAIQKGGFLACDGSIDIGVLLQKSLVKGCCSGLGFFIMEAKGVGRLLLSSFGSIIRYDIAPGEVRTIDNGFIVAWTTNMNYEVGKAASSYSASLFSGEGFVTRFTGPGTIFCQTRSIKGLADALKPYLPSGGGGGSSGG
jgi:uncharacterized protein (TIGR00266 family)